MPTTPWRERACGYGQKCRRDTKALFDHEAACYCTVLWFISEVYELHCRLESPLTVTEWWLTHINGSNAGWMRIFINYSDLVMSPAAISPTLPSSSCSSHTHRSSVTSSNCYFPFVLLRWCQRFCGGGQPQQNITSTNTVSVIGHTCSRNKGEKQQTKTKM